ncbi:MAG: ABC transporter substrate-binding protein [Thermoanaerobaculia bacterium]
MRRAAALIAVALAAVPAACREGVKPVRIAVHSAPQSFDPHLQNEILTSAVLANLYDGLTEFDEESRVVAALASEWRNPDERTWVFRLRPGVVFHDGRPLTARDVLFSLDRARHHSGSGLASYLVEVETVRSTDASTIEIRTRRPFAALLAKLTAIAIVPASSPAEIVEPVGTGSYRLARTTAEVVELVPAENGWRRGPLLPVTFVADGDPRRRLERLLAGQVDIATDLAEDAAERLERSECCRVIAQPGSTVEYLRLSAAAAPFRDRRVRQAIDLALDRAAYVAEAHGGIGQPAGQLCVPGVFGFAPDLKATVRDLPRARRLLAEAGFETGLDLVLEHRPGRRGDVLARQLAEVGIRVTLRVTPWTELHPRIRSGDVDFYFGGVVAQTAEASDVLDSFVHTRDDARGYGSTNHSRYSNPEADALIESASAALDLGRRRDLLQRAMKVVRDDLFLLPVAGLYDVYGLRREVRFEPRFDRRLPGRGIGRTR